MGSRVASVLVAVAAQRYGVVALFSEQPFAALARAATLARWNADFVQQWLGVADITGLTAREEEAQQHVDLGCQATTTAA